MSGVRNRYQLSTRLARRRFMIICIDLQSVILTRWFDKIIVAASSISHKSLFGLGLKAVASSADLVTGKSKLCFSRVQTTVPEYPGRQARPNDPPHSRFVLCHPPAPSRPYPLSSAHVEPRETESAVLRSGMMTSITTLDPCILVSLKITLPYTISYSLRYMYW